MNAGQNFVVRGNRGEPVSNGTIDPDGAVRISCKVAPVAGGFSVSAGIDVAMGAAGTLEVDGLVTASGPFQVDFKVGAAVYLSTTCTLTPTTTAAAGELFGIGAGHYWATFHCTDARTPSSSQLCAIDGEIRLEDCAQQ
jgi:hypothetical protein